MKQVARWTAAQVHFVERFHRQVLNVVEPERSDLLFDDVSGCRMGRRVRICGFGFGRLGSLRFCRWVGHFATFIDPHPLSLQRIGDNRDTFHFAVLTYLALRTVSPS